MKRVHKFFTIKTFIIFSIAIFLIIGIVMHEIDKKNKEEFELRKQAALNDEIDAYFSGEKCTFKDYLDVCRWNIKDITAIEFGLKTDDSGMSCYYFEDEEIVEKILDAIDGVKFLGSSNDDIAFELLKNRSWDIVFYKKNSDYSIRMIGYDTKYDGVNIVRASTVAVDYKTIGSPLYPDFYWIMDCENVYIKEDIYNRIYNVYVENVREISVSQIEQLRESKSTNLKDYFIYLHKFEEDINYYDENNELRVVLVYKFPIENTDNYVILQKFNEGGTSTADGVITKPPLHDIISVEVCNDEGEKLDLFQCSKEELEEFLQQGE